MNQREWFNSEEFREKYHYDGPLGTFCDKVGTSFYLWAPTAERVDLYLYPDGASSASEDRICMERGKQGVYSCYIPENLDGMYYDYMVTVDGIARQTADPYAKACGINGKRSMVIDLGRTNPEDWDKDRAPKQPEENIIYEIHVRDFSASEHSGVEQKWRGKFLALCQEGTTLDNDGIHPTGLDYLKRLGVTHIQLMPVFDYGSVDEQYPERNFNWGYDPVNYNVPEGIYSTNPWQGEVRIRELKEAIQALHRAGFRVIMDVVYNHTYSLDSWLMRTVPWYYYRQEEDGTPSNGSGCSNDLASERSMCGRYILDSVLYWTEEYHIDGFRFDLMGLLDVPLMNRIRAELDRRYGAREKILFGEPWAADKTSPIPGTALGDKKHLQELDPGIGAFCDATRDAVKGSVMNSESRGIVNGGTVQVSLLKDCLLGWTNSGKEFNAKAPSQTISYLSSHDDWTLWDKLVYSMDPKQDFEALTPELLQANRLAAAIAFGCRGTLFFLSGEEFARTKMGIKNSYASSITVNRLDWTRAWENKKLVDYYRGLLALRKRIPALTSKECRDDNEIIVEQISDKCYCGKIEDSDKNHIWKNLIIVYNVGEKEEKVELSGEFFGWKQLFNGNDSFLWMKDTEPISGTVRIPPMSAASWGACEKVEDLTDRIGKLQCS